MNLVSVCMITYNHEKYIREAIESILMQKTDFDFELVIANDNSPDNTNSIVNDIIKNHLFGYRIKYFEQEKNLGIMSNFLFALSKCKSKYTAICEGDDYWLTKDKLKKQITFLESNTGYGLSYTHIKHYNQQTQKFISYPPRQPKSRHDAIPMMLKSKFIEFATTVFRKEVLDSVLEIIKPELKSAVIGDTRILLETVLATNIHFLNEKTTVYRIVEGSASHHVDVDKYIYALLDTYSCRKTFVKRNQLNPKWLASSVGNTNRGLINHAFVANEYKDVLKFVSHLLIKDTFKYFDFNIFVEKINIKIIAKLLFSVFGLGLVRQNLKKIR